MIQIALRHINSKEPYPMVLPAVPGTGDIISCPDTSLFAQTHDSNNFEVLQVHFMEGETFVLVIVQTMQLPDNGTHNSTMVG